MEALKVVLIVLFVIISILLILLVLVQNDEGGGMGGLLSGAGSAAFGSQSASVINKTTFVLVILFLIISFGIARLNKASVSDLTDDETVEETMDIDAEAENWWENIDNEKKLEVEETISNSAE